MVTRNDWFTTAPRIIYENYPDADLLPIEPPKPGESIGEFKAHAEDAGDTLFLFLCREADDEIDVEEFLARLNRAIRDIQSVQAAFRSQRCPEVGARAEALAIALGGDIRTGRVIRLGLENHWIELYLGPPDSNGQAAGRMLSNLRAACGKDKSLNGAVDAVESIVLSHACAGFDVRDPRYIAGIQACLDACAICP